MEREWDEEVERPVRHEVHEPTTYELAEMELKSEEKKYIVQMMMGEQYDNYFWDERHTL